jgi:hypothetical protein
LRIAAGAYLSARKGAMLLASNSVWREEGVVVARVLGPGTGEVVT